MLPLHEMAENFGQVSKSMRPKPGRMSYFTPEGKSIESSRLIHCLKMHKRLFGVDVKKIGGDTGYAGTDNRDFCKENGIQTSFVKRGRSFSEEPIHIFFGIHTANMVQLADRIEQRAQPAAA